MKINQQSLLVGIVIVVGCVAFVILSVYTKIFTSADIPIQAMGAFFGAIVTAFITIMLLVGQTKAEEKKEMNVAVFTEKTKRYEGFIAKLWEVWQDRHVDLQEINDLLESVTKDILLFTPNKTTGKILNSLEAISKYSQKEKITKEEQKKLQGHVFAIINVLAKEMNLGGMIGKDELDTINRLEEKIQPLLEYRKNVIEYKAKFLNDFNETIGAIEPELGTAQYSAVDGTYDFISIKLERSSVELALGPIDFPQSKSLTQIAGFYASYYSNKTYVEKNYAKKSRGYWKDWLKQTEPLQERAHQLVNFNSMESVKNLVESYSKSQKVSWDSVMEDYQLSQKTVADKDKLWDVMLATQGEDALNPGAKAALYVLGCYYFPIDGKNIKQIIEECEGGDS